MKFIIVIFSLIILSACQSTQIRSEGRYIEADTGATIEILQPLTVHPNSARVFLQNGEPQPQGRLDLYEVSCEVEINTISEQPQTIAPGLFRIMSIVQDESPIVFLQPLKVAAIGVVWGNSDSPVDIKRFYRFKLQAVDKNSKSQVRSITCRGAQSEPYNAELPSLEEMRQASGSYLRFNL